MTPDDLITVRGIRGYGHHGVLPEERETGQLFIVDVELRTDVQPAAESDALTDTVDYSAVARAALDVVEGDPCDLIETVAVRIAEAVLALAPVVQVTVHKPQAPLGVPFEDVSVTVVRHR